MFESGSLVAVDAVGVLARNVSVRLLNCSGSGCLLETNSRLDVGTIASLHVTLGDRDLVDQIVVVRCQPIEGGGARFHVGARFLELAPPTVTAVRRVLVREAVAGAGSSACALTDAGGRADH
jgi:hypothetical protein